VKPSWDFVITFASIFLIPGVWLAIGAAANLAKFDRSLTTLGMTVYLAVGAILTAVGVSCLLELGGPWLTLCGFVAFGIWMVMEGTGRLYIRPYYSIAMQWIFMVAGIGILAFFAFMATD
jgi:hypothetical protein